jgi:hypothetical protein
VIEGWLRRGLRGWLRFWFEQEDLRPLELTRIGVGLSLFLIYFLQAGHVREFYTSDGWVPLGALSTYVDDPTLVSVLYTVTDPSHVVALWWVMLFAAVALTVGFQTPWVKWVAWLLHMSFCNRAPEICYGVDYITANLLMILCLTPVGRMVSVDAWLGHKRSASLPWLAALQRARASVGLRLVQIQTSIVFFFAGTEKLQGQDWWDGDAIWYAMTDYEFNILPLTFFAENMWLVNALTYGSLMIELGYAFLIWDRKTRPFFLVGALLLHVGVAVSMGLVLFAIPMIAGHVSFIPSAWLDRIRALKNA